MAETAEPTSTAMLCVRDDALVEAFRRGEFDYQKILQHLSLWEESQAPPESEPPIQEITFDPSYSQLI